MRTRLIHSERIQWLTVTPPSDQASLANRQSDPHPEDRSDVSPPIETDQVVEFARILEHDIRTPLTVAKAHLEMAQAGDDVPERLDAIARAHDQIERLLNDFRAVLGSGTFELEPESIDINAFAAERWRHIGADSSRLSVTLEDPIVADRCALRRILDNLFRNALTHGGSNVNVTVGGGNEPPSFFVSDDGNGIPPEIRERVKESGYTTSQRGTGFGLTIVEVLAAAHGWSVEIAESADGGARIEFLDVTIQ